MNKYGGVNDMPSGWTSESYLNKRIYQLWYDIHRRCYDAEQQARSRGRKYADCIVCERWHYLKNFVEDIQKLDGYEEWTKNGCMSIDKDMRVKEILRQYSPETCCFVTLADNVAEMNARTPDIAKAAQEACKATYVLYRNDEHHVFRSEKDACEYLGVKQCSIAGAWRDKNKCKGFNVIRIGTNADMRGGDAE